MGKSKEWKAANSTTNILHGLKRLKKGIDRLELSLEAGGEIPEDKKKAGSENPNVEGVWEEMKKEIVAAKKLGRTNAFKQGAIDSEKPFSEYMKDKVLEKFPNINEQDARLLGIGLAAVANVQHFVKPGEEYYAERNNSLDDILQNTPEIEYDENEDYPIPDSDDLDSLNSSAEYEGLDMWSDDESEYDSSDEYYAHLSEAISDMEENYSKLPDAEEMEINQFFADLANRLDNFAVDFEEDQKSNKESRIELAFDFLDKMGNDSEKNSLLKSLDKTAEELDSLKEDLEDELKDFVKNGGDLDAKITAALEAAREEEPEDEREGEVK